MFRLSCTELTFPSLPLCLYVSLVLCSPGLSRYMSLPGSLSSHSTAHKHKLRIKLHPLSLHHLGTPITHTPTHTGSWAANRGHTNTGSRDKHSFIVSSLGVEHYCNINVIGFIEGECAISWTRSSVQYLGIKNHAIILAGMFKCFYISVC